MTPELSTLLAVLVGAVFLVAVGVVWWINRTPTVAHDEDDELPLFGGLTPEERMRSPAASRPAVSATDWSRGAMATTPVTSPAVTTSERPGADPSRSAPVIREFDTRVATPTQAPATAATSSVHEQSIVNDAGVPGSMVEGHALRFSVPAEGTLQFLPGRLEIASGSDAGREIRFVRVDGPNGIEVSFGRADGEPYKHIQLRDKTVSRSHAVMRFDGARWSLQNLSHTNPVVHNGVQMAGDAVQSLADGDRVEMGEVIFTYRSH